MVRTEQVDGGARRRRVELLESQLEHIDATAGQLTESRKTAMLADGFQEDKPGSNMYTIALRVIRYERDRVAKAIVQLNDPDPRLPGRQERKRR